MASTAWVMATDTDRLSTAAGMVRVTETGMAPTAAVTSAEVPKADLRTGQVIPSPIARVHLDNGERQSTATVPTTQAP